MDSKPPPGRLTVTYDPILNVVILNDLGRDYEYNVIDQTLLTGVVEEATQKNYKVRVITEIRENREEVPFGGLRSPDYPVSETVEVRAHSELDARVMAFILVGHVPEDATPTWLIAMAYRYTEVIPQIS